MPAVNLAIKERVARVVLQRPPLNVIDLATARELDQVFSSLRDRSDLAAVVLEARGRAFSAGVDVKDHLPDRGTEMLSAFHRACLALAALETPTLAVVQGAALGGGAELTLMCDLVVAGENASFGFPEIGLGVFPPLAAVALPRMIPAHRAAEMILTGRALMANEAERIGLVNRVAPDLALGDVVEGLLETLRRLSPPSLRAAKRALALARVRPTADEIERSERLYVAEVLKAPDAIEGLRAFMEKRPPIWADAPAERPR